MEIRNSANETPYDVAVRYAQLACVKILGGDDLDSDSNSTIFSDDDDAPLHGLAGESCDNRGLVFDEKSKKASRSKRRLILYFYKAFILRDLSFFTSSQPV